MRAASVLFSVLGLAACGGRSDYVQFANGFDFEVTAKATSAEGKEQTIVIPAKGRVGAGLSGEYTVEFSSPTGVIKEKKFKFTEAKEQKDGCFQYVNVMGSAAIIESDIAYGIDIQQPDRLHMGNWFSKICPRWGFDEVPPESVTVEGNTLGLSKSWIHYEGEGDWVAAIDKLLAQKPMMGDQDRIMAWNIAFTVNKHDPNNARLAEQGPKFLAACDRIDDMFKTGPLAGKARTDCIANTKALFKMK